MQDTTTLTTTTTGGGQPHEGQTRTRRFVLPREITHDPAFRFRQTGTNRAHVRHLAQTLRNVSDLDPVLVWQEEDEAGQPTGRLVLLDGLHRLSAYATAKGHRAAIPAVVLTGDRAGATLAAVQANTRDSLALTKNERTDAAWRLVRPPGKRITVPAVAKAAGVAARTVDNMRKRWREKEAAGKEPTGRWWQDRLDAMPEMEDAPEMTDAERKAEIARIASAIREAVGKAPWQDQQLVAEALECALGTFKLRSMADYLFADDLAAETVGPFAGAVQTPEEDTAGQDF